MEPRTHSNKLLLSDLPANLITEAEEIIHDMVQETKQILDNLE